MGQEGTAFWLQFPRWVRGPARIEGEEIVLDGSRAETYLVHEPMDLLPDFAGLADGFFDSRDKWERQVLAFARRHGLLWHGPDEVEGGDCRESLEDWASASLRIRMAATLYVKLMEALESGSTEPLRQKARELQIDWTPRFGWAAEDDWHYLWQASVFLADAVNQGLAGSRHTIAAACALTDDGESPNGPPGVFLHDVHSLTLEAAAYVRFSHLMEYREELAECPGCGRPFRPKSGKQKYCTEGCASNEPLA